MKKDWQRGMLGARDVRGRLGMLVCVCIVFFFFFFGGVYIKLREGLKRGTIVSRGL